MLRTHTNRANKKIMHNHATSNMEPYIPDLFTEESESSSEEIRLISE
jgi:hypothetical protein